MVVGYFHPFVYLKSEKDDLLFLLILHKEIEYQNGTVPQVKFLFFSTSITSTDITISKQRLM